MCRLHLLFCLEPDVKGGSVSTVVANVFKIFVAGKNVRNGALLNPAEPVELLEHLFSENASELLHLTLTPSAHRPSLPSP